MSLISVFLVSLGAVLQPAPVSAAGQAIELEETARLERCVETMQTDPETAYENGLAWLGNGNRPKARHCVALSLVELGLFAEGATRLESLANAPDAGDLEARALFHAQAGSAYLLGDLPAAALVAIDNALKVRPGDTGLLLDRGTAHAALSNWDLAISDLNRVIADRPGDVDALTLRARAFLGDERFPEALADVSAARQLDPDAIDLLVLRGDIREARRLADERAG